MLVEEVIGLEVFQASADAAFLGTVWTVSKLPVAPPSGLDDEDVTSFERESSGGFFDADV